MSRKKIARRSIAVIFILAVAPFLGGCSSSETANNYPKSYPNTDALVYLSVNSEDEFSINNSTAAPIYYQTFPTELLPLIDWAPCENKKSCKSIQIMPNSSITLQIDSIRDYHSESLSVFWWHISRDDGSPNPEFFSPQHISFPIP